MYDVTVNLKDNKVFLYTDEFRTIEEIKELYIIGLKQDVFFIETREEVVFLKSDEILTVAISKNDKQQ